MAYQVKIEPCDNNLSSANPVKLLGAAVANGVQPRDHMVPTITVVKASTAQIAGLKAYIALINKGTNTGTVETAINAL